MTYKTSTSVSPQFVEIAATGHYSKEKMLEFISLCRSEAEMNGRNKVMIDCSQLGMDITEVDRFEGGKTFAHIFGPDYSVALLLPDGQVTKLGELAATNRGAHIIVTSSREEAIEFLLDS